MRGHRCVMLVLFIAGILCAGCGKTTAQKSDELRKSIVGQWVKADGSDLSIEFTQDGMFIMANTSGEKLVTLKDGKDLSFKCISDQDVQAEDFLFSVDIAQDELTMTGKGGVNMLQADGTFLPPSAGQSMKFKRKK